MTTLFARQWLVAALAVVLLAGTVCIPALAGNSVSISGVILPAAAPVARFSAAPLSGAAPLTVTFDASSSTGTITSYAWDFDNDGTVDVTSASATAGHTYTTAGSYTVKLMVTGPGGSDEEVKTDCITVFAAPGVHHVYWVANRPMDVVPGGALEFRVTGAYSQVTLDKKTYRLNAGDTVRLVTGSDTTGKIYATSSTINNFAFDDVHLFINGVDRGTGTIKKIWINGYDSFSSTLALDVPSISAWTHLEVDGTIVIDGTDSSRVQIFGLRPWAGVMNLDNTGSRSTYYDGGADSYLVTPVVRPPVAAFSGSPLSGGVPLAVQFTDQSTNGPTSWRWEYQKEGTGTWTLFSTAQHPSWTVTSPGQYSIRLTATNAAGSGTLTRDRYITAGQCGPLIAYFTGAPASGKKPLTVQFSDGSLGFIDTWAWDFQNDGTVDSQDQDPRWRYTAKGKYSVRLQVSNACATSIMIRYSYIDVR